MHFLEPDWRDRGVLVGTLADGDGAERIVAVGEYDRLRDPAAAEAAFAVADDLQRPRHRHPAARAARGARRRPGHRALRRERSVGQPGDAGRLPRRRTSR